MSSLSLNQIVSILSDRVGQPFNINLQNELKDIVTYKRANYTQQILSKDPTQRAQFTQAFTAEMEEVKETDCKVSLECPWYRTVCELPQPLRVSGVIWDYVGAADFTYGYSYLAPEFIRFHTSSRYTGSKPKWFWQNNRIIVTNTTGIKVIGIRGIPADPRKMGTCLCQDTGQCFDDDSPFPMIDDILNAIVRDTLNVELRNVFPQPATVVVDTKEDTTVAGSE